MHCQGSGHCNSIGRSGFHLGISSWGGGGGGGEAGHGEGRVREGNVFPPARSAKPKNTSN